jgi:hypothetical protein
LWTTFKGMLPVKHKAARVFDPINLNGKQVALLSVSKCAGAFIEKAILVGEAQDSVAIYASLAVPVGRSSMRIPGGQPLMKAKTCRLLRFYRNGNGNSIPIGAAFMYEGTHQIRTSAPPAQRSRKQQT